MEVGYGLNQLAIGIIRSHAGRVNKVNELNDLITSYADNIRSSSDMDGMPHAITVGDPAGSRAIKIEAVEPERDAEAERIGAVEWACDYVRSMFREDYGDTLIEALFLCFNGRKREAIQMIRERTEIADSAFYRARSAFIKQVLVYLKLWQ